MSVTKANPARSSLAERYRVLLEIARTLTGTLTPEDLYRAIHQETAKVIEAAGFYIALYDQARDLATVVFYADRGREEQVQISYRGSDSDVIRTGKPSMIRDGLSGHSLMILGDEESEVTRSAISAPLRYKGRVTGLLSAQSYEPDTYREDDLELLQGIADVAAVAVENARYVSEVRRRRLEAEQIEEIGRALTSSLEHDEVVRKVIDAATDLLRADGATVWLFDEGARTATIAESRGEVALPVGERLELSPRLREEIVEHRRPLLIDNVQDSDILPPGLKKYLKSRSGLAVPLVIGDEVAGALSAGVLDKRGFSDEDTHLLQRLASQAAVALENAKLHGEVQALTLTDPLTKLPNRRHLKMHLEKEFAAARRGRMLAAIVFDLDDFKRYNDSLGHIAGDEALRRVARILDSESRAMNLAARFGGDEFISVVSDTPMDGCRFHARRVVELIEEDPVLSGHGLTVSYGTASFDSSMKTPEDLIEAADQDMYRNKRDRQNA